MIKLHKAINNNYLIKPEIECQEEHRLEDVDAQASLFLN